MGSITSKMAVFRVFLDCFTFGLPFYRNNRFGRRFRPECSLGLNYYSIFLAFLQEPLLAEPDVRGIIVPQTLDGRHDLSDLPEIVLSDAAADVQRRLENARRLPGVHVQVSARNVQLVPGIQPLLLPEGRMPTTRVVGHIALLLQ